MNDDVYGSSMYFEELLCTGPELGGNPTAVNYMPIAMGTVSHSNVCVSGPTSASNPMLCRGQRHVPVMTTTSVSDTFGNVVSTVIAREYPTANVCTVDSAQLLQAFPTYSVTNPVTWSLSQMFGMLESVSGLVISFGKSTPAQEPVLQCTACDYYLEFRNMYTIPFSHLLCHHCTYAPQCTVAARHYNILTDSSHLCGIHKHMLTLAYAQTDCLLSSKFKSALANQCNIIPVKPNVLISPTGWRLSVLGVPSTVLGLTVSKLSAIITGDEFVKLALDQLDFCVTTRWPDYDVIPQYSARRAHVPETFPNVVLPSDIKALGTVNVADLYNSACLSTFWFEHQVKTAYARAQSLITVGDTRLVNAVRTQELCAQHSCKSSVSLNRGIDCSIGLAWSCIMTQTNPLIGHAFSLVTGTGNKQVTVPFAMQSWYNACVPTASELANSVGRLMSILQLAGSLRLGHYASSGITSASVIMGYFTENPLPVIMAATQHLVYITHDLAPMWVTSSNYAIFDADFDITIQKLVLSPAAMHVLGGRFWRNTVADDRCNVPIQVGPIVERRTHVNYTATECYRFADSTAIVSIDTSVLDLKLYEMLRTPATFVKVEGVVFGAMVSFAGAAWSLLPIILQRQIMDVAVTNRVADWTLPMLDLLRHSVTARMATFMPTLLCNLEVSLYVRFGFVYIARLKAVQCVMCHQAITLLVGTDVPGESVFALVQAHDIAMPLCAHLRMIVVQSNLQPCSSIVSLAKVTTPACATVAFALAKDIPAGVPQPILGSQRVTQTNMCRHCV